MDSLAAGYAHTHRLLLCIDAPNTTERNLIKFKYKSRTVNKKEEEKKLRTLTALAALLYTDGGLMLYSR